MKNRMLCFISLIVLSMAFACASWSRTDASHNIIDPATEKLLKSAAETIDFDIGYSNKYDVVYLYRISSSGKAAAAQEREFAKILNSASKADLVKLFDAVLRINQTMNHKIAFFEKQRNWKDYTYYKNYLLPPAEEFHAQLKKALIAKDSSFAELEKQMTPKALEWANWYYRYQEEAVDIFP